MAARTYQPHRQSAQSQARILEAASAIVAEIGYEGASLSRVSERSGLPTGSIHWHFGTKEQLIAAALRYSFDLWQEQMSGWEPDDETGIETGTGTGAMDETDIGRAVRAIIGPLAASVRLSPTFFRMGMRLALDQRPVTAAARAVFTQYRADGFATAMTALDRLLPGRIPPDQRVTTTRNLTRFIMAATDGVILAREMGEQNIDVDAHFGYIVTSAVGALTA